MWDPWEMLPLPKTRRFSLAAFRVPAAPPGAALQRLFPWIFSWSIARPPPEIQPGLIFNTLACGKGQMCSLLRTINCPEEV